CVKRRVENTDIAAAGFDLQQIALASRHSEHISERAKDHIGQTGNTYGLIDEFQRCHTDWTARPMNQLNACRQKILESVLTDRVCLSATNLHDCPFMRYQVLELIGQLGSNFCVPVFVQIFHSASGTLKVFCASARSPETLSASYCRAASASLMTLIANPT